mgnify:CR=1 FL=1
MDITNLTQEHIFNIANIATGGYFKSDLSSSQKENQVGGYGRRRQVEWIMDGEKHFFELNGSDKSKGWNWYSWTIDSYSNKQNINCIDNPSVVDYCDKNNINIRNN